MNCFSVISVAMQKRLEFFNVKTLRVKIFRAMLEIKLF